VPRPSWCRCARHRLPLKTKNKNCSTRRPEGLRPLRRSSFYKINAPPRPLRLSPRGPRSVSTPSTRLPAFLAPPSPIKPAFRVRLGPDIRPRRLGQPNPRRPTSHPRATRVRRSKPVLPRPDNSFFSRRSEAACAPTPSPSTTLPERLRHDVPTSPPRQCLAAHDGTAAGAPTSKRQTSRFFRERSASSRPVQAKRRR